MALAFGARGYGTVITLCDRRERAQRAIAAVRSGRQMESDRDAGRAELCILRDPGAATIVASKMRPARNPGLASKR